VVVEVVAVDVAEITGWSIAHPISKAVWFMSPRTCLLAVLAI
jgi:hypothetical protein